MGNTNPARGMRDFLPQTFANEITLSASSKKSMKNTALNRSKLRRSKTSKP